MSNALTDLDRFSGGTENWYQHQLVRRVTYTDGVRHVAQAAGAYWLIDKVAIVGTLDNALKAQPWQAWKLTVKDGKGEIVVEDGNDGVLYRETIDWTDFPEPGVTLWFIDGVILLPVEY